MIEGIFYYELDRATAQVDVIQRNATNSFNKCFRLKWGCTNPKAPKNKHVNSIVKL